MMAQKRPEPSGLLKDDFTAKPNEEEKLLPKSPTMVPPSNESIITQPSDGRGDTETRYRQPAEPEAHQGERQWLERHKQLLKCILASSCFIGVLILVAFVIHNSVQLIHKGSWKEWEEWTHCSAKCGGGLQHRERTCGYLICGPGQPLEYQVCNKILCSGSWNEWSEWAFCSATCGSGLQNRTRTCDGGKCDTGQPIDYQMCNKYPCAGRWNEWSEWTFCSATCGGGLQNRSRTCDGGKCDTGQPIDYQMCNKNPCAGNFTAFSVKGPKKITEGNLAYLTFEENIYQKGNGFNFSTGKFICTIPGIYLFSVTLVKKESYNSIICHLWKTQHLYQKEDQLISLILNPSNDSVHAAISSTVVIELNNHDSVYISHCTGAEQSIEKWSVFTGVLLYPFN